MPPASEKTKIVRQKLEEACEDFTVRVEPMGFRRTKKMLWVRRHEHTIDFIHFHRCGSTYGTPLNYSTEIRMEFGIRVISDCFVAPALNGPHIDANVMREGRYHLRFNAKTGSTYHRCVDDLVRLLVERAEPWFQRFRDPGQLLKAHDSPLQDEARRLLEHALNGQSNPENEAASLKMLGIKDKKTG